MKKNIQLIFFLLFTILSLIPVLSCAQTPSWQWARQAGANFDVSACSVTTDKTGNIYVLGGFSSSTITFGGISLLNKGAIDIFLVKYNSLGSVIWAKNFGGKDLDEGTSVTADRFGNLYVAGCFYSDTLMFGSDTLINVGIPGYQTGTTDMFLVKYDVAGNELWARRAGGALRDSGLTVTTDISGNVYVAGTFSSHSIIFGADTLTNSGNYDMFIARYDAAGNALWAKCAGGNYLDCAQSVTTDALSNCYVAGAFHSDTIAFDTTNLANPGNPLADIFIVKYNAEGNVIWAKRAGGTQGDFAQSISSDASGDIYMAGYFYGPGATFGFITLTNGYWNYSNAVFLAKYNTDGNVLWATKPESDNADFGWSVVSDSSGNNIYMTGQFSSNNFIFGLDTLHSPNNSYDIYIVKYDSLGNIIWTKSAGGNDEDIVESIAADASGNVYITGYFQSPSITFGPSILTTSNWVAKMFIAKLGISTGIENFENQNDMLIYPNPTNGNVILEINFDKLENIIISLYNIIGERVYNETVNNAYGLFQKNINILGLSNGIYFIQIKVADAIMTKKIIKQ